MTQWMFKAMQAPAVLRKMEMKGGLPYKDHQQQDGWKNKAVAKAES